MGGDAPLDWLGEIMSLALGKGVYDGGNGELLTADVLDERMDSIEAALARHGARDAYIGWQVLGHEIITRGAKLTESVKRRVLEAIDQDEWALDGDQERIQHMGAFKSAVTSYRDGEPVRITHECLFERIAEYLQSGPGAEEK